MLYRFFDFATRFLREFGAVLGSVAVSIARTAISISTLSDKESTSKESHGKTEHGEEVGQGRGHEDMYPDSKPVELVVQREIYDVPTTEQQFSIRRITDGETTLDISITRESLPRDSFHQRRQLQVFSNVSDLKHLCPRIRDRIEWLKHRGLDHVPISRLAGCDFASKKILTSIQSMLTEATVSPLPPQGVLFVTINFASTPELPAWIAAGGKSPMLLVPSAIDTMKTALQEDGCTMLFMDGWFEIQDRGTPGRNARSHLFERDYAKANWPAPLFRQFRSTKVFTSHFHIVMAAFDETALIDRDRVYNVLKAKFPGRNSVDVLEMIDKTLHADEAARCRRYAIKKPADISDAQLIEDARWREALKASNVMFSGWETYGAVNSQTKLQILRSKLARAKIAEALEDVEIA